MDLPPDLSYLPVKDRLLETDKTTAEFCMTCDNLKTQLEQTHQSIRSVENQLISIQNTNQSKGSIGILLFSPVMLTMQSTDELSAEYRQLDKKKDLLQRIKNARARACE